MLKWYEENGKHLGFDDDTYVYRVAEDENGWYYEHIMTQDGLGSYNTAEEAKAAAEEDYEDYEAEMRRLLEIDEESFDPDEAFMVLADLLYEQRREEQMGW
jgi:hypothetical protein